MSLQSVKKKVFKGQRALGIFKGNEGIKQMLYLKNMH